MQTDEESDLARLTLFFGGLLMGFATIINAYYSFGMLKALALHQVHKFPVVKAPLAKECYLNYNDYNYIQMYNKIFDPSSNPLAYSDIGYNHILVLFIIPVLIVSVGINYAPSSILASFNKNKKPKALSVILTAFFVFFGMNAIDYLVKTRYAVYYVEHRVSLSKQLKQYNRPFDNIGAACHYNVISEQNVHRKHGSSYYIDLKTKEKKLAEP